MASNAIQVGSKVRFLNDVGEGVVTQCMDKDQVMVEDQNGFEFPHAINQLILIVDRQAELSGYDRSVPTVAEILQQEVSSSDQRAIEKDFNSRYTEIQEKRLHTDQVEVDLHMHQLVDSQRGLTPGAMLELQLAHFERMLRIGIEQKTKRMVFIHGIGQGTLRHQIWSRIEQFYPNCSCRSADPRRYGSGATEVWIDERALSR